MKNTYLLNIQGTSFAIRSEESEEYIRRLEEKVSSMIEDITSQGASSHKAALFVCMDLIDRLEKAEKSGNHYNNHNHNHNHKHKKHKDKHKKSFAENPVPDKNQLSLF